MKNIFFCKSIKNESIGIELGLHGWEDITIPLRNIISDKDAF